MSVSGALGLDAGLQGHKVEPVWDVLAGAHQNLTGVLHLNLTGIIIVSSGDNFTT